MIKIRRGVFETNSSSVHAMIISKRKPLVFQNIKKVNFHLGEYEWGYEELHTVDEKASYLYTAACCFYNKDAKDMILKALSGLPVSCRFDKPLFVNYGDGEFYLDNGNVDHCDELENFLKDILHDKEMLRQYLFDDQSFVVIGNDNCDDERIEQAGEVDYPHYYYEKGN